MNQWGSPGCPNGSQDAATIRQGATEKNVVLCFLVGHFYCAKMADEMPKQQNDSESGICYGISNWGRMVMLKMWVSDKIMACQFPMNIIMTRNSCVFLVLCWFLSRFLHAMEVDQRIPWCRSRPNQPTCWHFITAPEMGSTPKAQSGVNP